MTGREALERAIAAQGDDWADAADWLAGRVIETLAEDGFAVVPEENVATDYEVERREPASPQPMDGMGMGVIARSLGVSRPRTTEDIEAVRTRAAVRLERRLRRVGKSLRERDARLCREAAALVAALDALLDEREENMEAWAHGDR